MTTGWRRDGILQESAKLGCCTSQRTRGAHGRRAVRPAARGRGYPSPLLWRASSAGPASGARLQRAQEVEEVLLPLLGEPVEIVDDAVRL